MEKISFNDVETGESIELFILEQTSIQGIEYILATDSDNEEEDAEAYILKVVSIDGDDVVYEFVDNDNELNAIMKVFAELIDEDIEM